MRPVVLILSLAYLCSCSGNQEVSGKLSGSDSLVINFYATQSETIVNTVSTTEKSAIRRLSEFVSAKETGIFKCGYDGTLLFYEKGKLVSDVSFQYRDASCRHFLLDIKGELKSTRMSNEAADFLKGLAEGKDSY